MAKGASFVLPSISLILSFASENIDSFSIIREHELPAYTSVASGIKTITISPPLSYAAGDYVGLYL